MTLTISTIVFGILSALCLIGLITLFVLPSRILCDEKRWKLIQPEALSCICFSMFAGCTILALQCAIV
jgi:hypothetical protein